MNVEIKTLIAGILKVDVANVTDDLAIGDIPEWDSLHQLTIIMELQKQFEIKFSREELIDLETVADIVSLVEEKASVK